MSDSCGSCTFQDTSYLQEHCTNGGTAYLFLTLIDYIVRSSCTIADPCNRASTGDKQDKKVEPNYDFIVIGGGTGGCVVAGRLGEAKNNATVLLLEAGEDEASSLRVPGLLANIVGSRLDYSYKTEKNEKACLQTDGICTWPRGKLLSGTGAFSGMLYTRPSPSIFDEWAGKLGNKGWSSKEVLEYFKKSENNLNPDLIDKDQHGTSGPMTIQRFGYHPPMAEDIKQAAEALGYKSTDLSGSNPNGLNYVQAMVDKGKRGTTARMYLTDKYNQSNIYVKIKAQVQKIVFNGTKAVSVVFKDLKTNEIVTVNVNKEVVLSAGVIGTPQLLLLSGIGPKEQLDSLSIPVVKDLKVGSHLLHHVSCAVNYTMNDNFVQHLTLDELLAYLNNQTGELSAIALVQLTGFFKSSFNSINDLQFYFDGFETDCSRTGYKQECKDGKLLNGTANHDDFIAKLNSLKTDKNKDFIEDIIKKYDEFKGEPVTEPLACGRRKISVRPNNLLPKSIGSLVLKSNNVDDHPKLITNYLTDEQDAKMLLEGVRIIQKIMSSESLKKYDIQPTFNTHPSCTQFKEDTDDYWLCMIKIYTLAENHHTGTCKMGQASDPEAVVSENLTIHGIDNVKIADASIFPTQLNCNPISVIIMTAEKCADMILTKYKT